MFQSRHGACLGMTTPVDHLRQYVDFTLPRFPQRNPRPDVHGWSRVFASRFWDLVEDVLPLPLDELLRDELRGSLWSAPLFQHNWFPVSRSLRVDVPEDVVAEIRRLEWESPPTRLEQALVHQARRSLHTYGLFVPPAIFGVLDDFASLSLIGCSYAAACLFAAVSACDSLTPDDRVEAELLLAPARALLAEHYKKLDPERRALFDYALACEEKIRRGEELGEADWERGEDVVLAMVHLAAFLWRRRAERVVS